MMYSGHSLIQTVNFGSLDWKKIIQNFPIVRSFKFHQDDRHVTYNSVY